MEPEEKLKRIYFYVSEPFTEVEPRIKGNKNEELEEYKKNNFKEYEERVNKSGIIQSFNHAIAQQNQVELRVGLVMFEFVYKFEDKEVHNGLKAKIPIPQLKLRQKQIDALLVHDITKAILHQTTRVYFVVQQGYRFCACVRSRLGERL